jgi:D-glycero-D-manno-heptose 1,7-bisphosphate phosphatase
MQTLLAPSLYRSTMPINRRLVGYVFLDRDGVVNRKLPEGAYVTDWEQFEWLPGAVEAIAALNRAGMTVILVSNQRGIALGLFTHDQLELIHANMRVHLAQHGAQLDAIYYCPHDVGECQCRKPDVGLFEQAYRDFPQASADNSVVIGDSLSDMQAGQRLGMKTIFIQGEAGRQKAGATAAAESADAVAVSLLDAVALFV